jgi:hypothetical protein
MAIEFYRLPPKKLQQYQISLKFVQWRGGGREAELFHAEGQTDRQTDRQTKKIIDAA